ncbi:glycosyltransferase family 4 protein [Arthrobacter sp. ISL-48]|uniref:glycosyltransferase family 4 protein n=1 Tax=Arthrobacter sp. ISL-48 TaxID=2819110 RepID=UPI001BEB9E35|nr:glycosyltransferase family 4 protein [Arthrobacter sp. ISL-48]MBT2531210.1 glycosyltransferase family 4 protein [Arthrobacter sp. ISL-48]
MRIGLIAGPWIPVPPVAYGGIERVVDCLARGFLEAGHDVVLAAPSDSQCRAPRVPGMRTSEPADIGSTLSELSHVIRAYEGMQDVDIIHDHTLAGPLCRLRPPGVPVVTTIHGLLTPSTADVYRAAGANTSIVAISRDQASHAPDVHVTEVIHHGIELSAVPVGTGRGGYLCFVGRMCPDKGVLEAIQLAQKTGIPLKIAAKMRETDEIRYFQDVIKPLLGSNEEFVGEIGDAEKYELMGEAMAFLNPIQWAEPFGLVMIESLATGTPVVGTPIGSAPEIVEHGRTGYLAATDELADLVPAAAGLSRAACRASIEKRFSADRMVADHLRLFASLLEEKPDVGVPAAVDLGQNRPGELAALLRNPPQ